MKTNLTGLLCYDLWSGQICQFSFPELFSYAKHKLVTVQQAKSYPVLAELFHLPLSTVLMINCSCLLMLTYWIWFLYLLIWTNGFIFGDLCSPQQKHTNTLWVTPWWCSAASRILAAKISIRSFSFNIRISLNDGMTPGNEGSYTYTHTHLMCNIRFTFKTSRCNTCNIK